MANTQKNALTYDLKVSGKSYSQNSTGGVASVVVEEHVDMIGMLVMRVSASEDWTYKIGDDVTLKVEKEEVFSGTLTGLEPSFSVETGPALTLRAMDPLYKLTRGRKTRQFDKMSDSDAVKKVLSDAGLSASVDTTSPKHEYILQRNESDMAFVRRLAARNNFMLRMEKGKACFKKAQYSGNGMEIEIAQDSNKPTIQSLEMKYSAADQVQEFVVHGWDYNKKEQIVGKATSSNVDKIGDGELGLKICGSMGKATAYVTDVPVTNHSLAEVMAKSELNRLSRQFLRGTARLRGGIGVDVRAGAMITFKGLPAKYNGRFFVVSTRRSWSTGGTFLDVQFCSNCAGT